MHSTFWYLVNRTWRLTLHHSKTWLLVCQCLHSWVNIIRFIKCGWYVFWWYTPSCLMLVGIGAGKWVREYCLLEKVAMSEIYSCMLLHHLHVFCILHGTDRVPWIKEGTTTMTFDGRTHYLKLFPSCFSLWRQLKSICARKSVWSGLASLHRSWIDARALIFSKHWKLTNCGYEGISIIIMYQRLNF